MKLKIPSLMLYGSQSLGRSNSLRYQESIISVCSVLLKQNHTQLIISIVDHVFEVVFSITGGAVLVLIGT